MRLTRHAKSGLRYLSRRWEGVAEGELLAKLDSAVLVGRTRRATIDLSVEVGGMVLTVIVDPEQAVVVTIWKED